MHAHAEADVTPTTSATEAQRRDPSSSAPGATPRMFDMLRLQRMAGNRAVTNYLGSVPVVQREGPKKPLSEVINGDDPDALKEYRPFSSLGPGELRKICRLVIDKNTWVGPDDEKTLESAWRAAIGLRDSLGAGDWDLWKECEGYGAEIKLVPWMQEARTTFADHVRTAAVRNVDNNLKAIQDAAKGLGIVLGDEQQPAPTQQNDEAVAHQRALASQIKEAHVKLKALRGIPVGYDPPSWGKAGGGEAPGLPPGGIPSEVEAPILANFDPQSPPFTRATPDPNPVAGIAKYEAVKAIHDEMTAAIGTILNANPVLYALTARGGTDAVIGTDVGAARQQMAKALGAVLVNATETKADIESRSLRFVELTPVHQAVSKSDPQFQGGFTKKLAADYLEEEGAADAAAGKLVSLLTIALITAVEVASGGTATPVIAAVISLAASAGTTAVSWNDWAKLETAAKSTVSDQNAVVTQEQADTAMLGALISTAAAMIDVYGLGKAVRAASAGSQAAVKALEDRVSSAAQLKKAAAGGGAMGKEVLERSVASLGPAATVRSVGSWQKLTSALGDSTAMTKLSAWRGEAFKKAEQAAAKAAVGKQGEAARAVLAVASGLEQAALGEALDGVIELIGGKGDPEMGHIGVGGTTATLDLDAIAEQVAARTPLSRSLQRSIIEVVEIPFSELKLASMSPGEFERIIRQGTSSGYFAQQGLPRMTVLDAKIHGGGHGYDGLGISKQGNLIQLYNVECKHVTGGSEFAPALSFGSAGTQGGLRWNETKARLLLSAENEFAEQTRADLTRAIRQRVPGFNPASLEETLAGALRSSKFYVFTPVWAKTEFLLAQMRGLASSGLGIGKLVRVAPRRR